jgi:hypothetical protein
VLVRAIALTCAIGRPRSTGMHPLRPTLRVCIWQNGHTADELYARLSALDTRIGNERFSHPIYVLSVT